MSRVKVINKDNLDYFVKFDYKIVPCLQPGYM